MLQVYFGSDTNKVRAAAFAASAGGATVIEAEQFQVGSLRDAVEAHSLFGGLETYVIDTPAGDLAHEVDEVLPVMATSAHTFIVIEGPLLAAAKKKYQKHTRTFEEFTATKSERFNTFAAADALARKDKKQLWVLLQSARQAGISNEEIIGVFWWQLKVMRLAGQTSSAAEAGQKDFSYTKAKRALATVPLVEVERLSHELLTLYHDGHAGEVDLDAGLEAWCLTL